MLILSERKQNKINVDFSFNDSSMYNDLEEFLFIIKAYSIAFAKKISELENPDDFEKDLTADDMLRVISFRLIEEAFPKGSLETIMEIIKQYANTHSANACGVTQ